MPINNNGGSPTTKRQPPPNPFKVDYAPTNRASCKKCLGTIGLNTIRFHRKVWSPFHDGYDTLFYHLRCGLSFASKMEDITSAEALKWADIVKLAKKFSLTIDESHAQVLELKQQNSLIWSLVPLLLKLQKSALFSILNENQYFYGAHILSQGDAAYRIADGLVLGKMSECPSCGLRGLIQEGSQIRCCGYVSGTLHCSYRNELFSIFKCDATNQKVIQSELREGPLLLPEEAKRMPLFLNWKPPRALPSIQQFGSAYTFSSLLKDGDPKMTHVPQNYPYETAVEFDSEEEMQSVATEGRALSGISFSSVCLSDPPTQKLIKAIVENGGQYNKKMTGKETYLLVGNIENAKTTKQYAVALSFGTPIVHCWFVPALLSRERSLPKCTLKEVPKILKNIEVESRRLPKGLILRQRKFARFYKFAGNLTAKIPRISQLLEKEEKERFDDLAKATNETKKRRIIRGSSPLLTVDPLVKAKGGKIYVNDQNCAYNCCTTYTEIKTGTNKFYNIQIIEYAKKKANTYTLFKKWGRIGSSNLIKNGNKTENYSTKLTSAVAAFENKFYGLTGLKWMERYSKPQQPGRYSFVELDGYASDDGESIPSPKKRALAKAERTQELELQCSLEAHLRDLIALLFDKKMMEKKMAEENLNLDKMPLGSISKRRLKEGYLILQKIQNLILTDNAGNSEKHKIQLAACTNEFYSKIPHTFDASKTPPIIDSLVKLKKKINMMEQILEVSDAVTLMDERTLDAKDKHPLDIEYLKLPCKVTYVSSDDPMYHMIAKMVKDTHASTHNTYTLSVDSIFAVDKVDEFGAFDSSIKNRRMLWHGSKLTNWVGVLSNGLRIAPPEAPSTGYMFGKGIYFADMVSKSANYCFASVSDPTGIVLLCEVALGNQLMRLEADYDALEVARNQGFDSTWGVGKSQPDPLDDQFIISKEGDEICVATGKQCDNERNVNKALSQPGAGKKVTLLYNEHIVYKQSQVRIRYIVKLKFDFSIASFDD